MKARALWGWAAWLCMLGAAWAQSPLPADDERQAFFEATQALKRGDLDWAEVQFKALQASLPYRPEIINNLGVLAHLRGNAEQAALLFSSAAQFEPHYFSVYMNAQRSRPGADKRGARDFAIIDELPMEGVKAVELSSAQTRPRQSTALAVQERLRVSRVKEAEEALALAAKAGSMDSGLRRNDGGAAVIPGSSVIPAQAGIHAPPLPDAIEQWRKAWQAQDIKAYLAFYAPDFVPSPALPRRDWEARRRAVFAKPKAAVNLSFDKLVTQALPGQQGSEVSFNQTYSANDHADQGVKTMQWRLVDGKWRILSERFVGR